MSEPGYVAETLAWCNARRKEQGKEPLERLPRGQVGDARSCPCGAATGLRVFAGDYYDPKDNVSRPTNRAVGRFVDAFDSGRLPQYRLAASPLKEGE